MTTTASASQAKSSWRALLDFINDEEEDDSDDDSDLEVLDTSLPVIRSAGIDRENQPVDIKPGSAALLVSCSILFSDKICRFLVNSGSF